ncbi:hypothetical protein D3C81_1581730 [compost metagenome]
MQAVVNARDACIVTIHRQNVLGQIVRTDRDEIYAIGQLWQHKDHRWDFKHHAEARFGNRITDHLFHFAPSTFDQATRFVDFIQTGHHRQKNAEISGGCVSTQHGAHLHQENLRLIERNADPTPAKARVFFTDRHVRQLFIRANIQRSQGDGLVVKHLQHSLILRHLLLFGREAALQHERNFSAVQANAVDTAAELLFVRRTKACIEHHLNPLAAFQLRGQIDVIFRQAA